MLGGFWYLKTVYQCNGLLSNIVINSEVYICSSLRLNTYGLLNSFVIRNKVYIRPPIRQVDSSTWLKLPPARSKPSLPLKLKFEPYFEVTFFLLKANYSTKKTVVKLCNRIVNEDNLVADSTFYISIKDESDNRFRPHKHCGALRRGQSYHTWAERPRCSALQEINKEAS